MSTDLDSTWDAERKVNYIWPNILASFPVESKNKELATYIDEVAKTKLKDWFNDRTFPLKKLKPMGLRGVILLDP